MDNRQKLKEAVPHGKRERYTPNDVHVTTLYCLLRYFTYEKTLYRESQSTLPIVCYRFKRPDGVFINYFHTVKDGHRDAHGEPLLANWVEKINELAQAGDISFADITLVPLVQVRNRQHFNTVLINGDPEKKTVKVVRIEPRSNDRTLSLPLSNYPVEDVRAHFVPPRGVKLASENALSTLLENQYAVEFQHAYLGLQALMDDETCGAQHVNSVEIISHLPVAEIQNQKRLVQLLKNADMQRRETDLAKIAYVRDHFKQVNKEMPKEVSKKQPSEPLARKVSEIKVLQRKPADADPDGFVAISKEQTASATQAKYTEDQFIHDLGAPGTVNLVAEKDHLPIKCVNATVYAGVIANLETYEKIGTSYSLFGGHTRQQTASTILDLVKKLSVQASDPFAQQKENMYKIAHLLYAVYFSIGGANSKLRDQIERSLSQVLDCATEYQAIASKATASIDRLTPARKLFMNRMQLLDASMPPQQKIHAKTDEALIKTFGKISELDTGLMYKLSSNKRLEVDKQRAELLAEVKYVFTQEEPGLDQVRNTSVQVIVKPR